MDVLIQGINSNPIAIGNYDLSDFAQSGDVRFAVSGKYPCVYLSKYFKKISFHTAKFIWIITISINPYL
jgi:hypothetical protein